jgi:hypothetical protein
MMSFGIHSCNFQYSARNASVEVLVLKVMNSVIQVAMWSNPRFLLMMIDIRFGMAKEDMERCAPNQKRNTSNGLIHDSY